MLALEFSLDEGTESDASGERWELYRRLLSVKSSLPCEAARVEERGQSRQSCQGRRGKEETQRGGRTYLLVPHANGRGVLDRKRVHLDSESAHRASERGEAEEWCAGSGVWEEDSTLFTRLRPLVRVRVSLCATASTSLWHTLKFSLDDMVTPSSVRGRARQRKCSAALAPGRGLLSWVGFEG